MSSQRGEAQAHDHRAVDLPLMAQGVQHRARVVGGRDLTYLKLARFRIHLHLRHLRHHGGFRTVREVGVVAGDVYRPARGLHQLGEGHASLGPQVGNAAVHDVQLLGGNVHVFGGDAQKLGPRLVRGVPGRAAVDPGAAAAPYPGVLGHPGGVHALDVHVFQGHVQLLGDHLLHHRVGAGADVHQ